MTGYYNYSLKIRYQVGYMTRSMKLADRERPYEIMHFGERIASRFSDFFKNGREDVTSLRLV